MKTFLFLLLSTITVWAATPTNADFPLGPIGGTFRIASGDNFARVTALTSGAPGDQAGLQVGDFIFGSDGVPFDQTGERFQGVTRQLGWAIEQAEATDGILTLDVLRASVGTISLDVNIGQNGSFSPAMPLNSAKWESQYETALTALNDRLLNVSRGNGIGYPTGWAGLALLSHPDWNQTTGPRPYGLGVQRVYDYYKVLINRAVPVPYEEKLFDKTDNPHYTDEFAVYLENWYIGLGTMFFAEYYEKNPTPENLALLQKAAELCGSRIQWWRQPNTSTFEYTTLRPGIVGHAGVSGDYMHYTWGGGINIVGVHLSGGLAMAKRAGADMSVAPDDGRYFGYDKTLFNSDPSDDTPGATLPAGLTLSGGGTLVEVNGVALPFIPTSTTHPDIPNVDEFVDRNPTLDEKLHIIWDFYKRSQNIGTGHINYLIGSGGLGDSSGRTSGVHFTRAMMLAAGMQNTATDQSRYDLLQGYHNTQYDRVLDVHVTNMQGPAFYMMGSSAFETRERQHFLDNNRFFYNLMRSPNGQATFMRGRGYGGGSGNNDDLANLYFALPYGIANGGLAIAEGYDTSNQRLVDFSKVPHIQWKELATRSIKTKATSIPLDLEVTDGAGLPSADYTASWTSPDGAMFSSTNTLDTTITVPSAGEFNVLLTVTSGDGSIVTQEPITVQALPPVDETLYCPGLADYHVYSDITGSAVSDLTSSAKFPDSPDITKQLDRLKGDATGNSFGATLTTTIVAPETGTYRFYLVTDDQGSLLFNANGPDPAGAVEIASVPGWAGSGQWDKYASQQSAEITLTAGQHYYLQGLMKEGGGAEPFEIGWTTPSNSTIEIIGSAFIAAPKNIEPAAFTKQPVDIVTTLGETVLFDIEVTGPEPRLFQWQLNGENYGAPQTTPDLEITNSSAYLGGQWRVIYSSGDTVLTSDTVTLTFSDVGQLVNGCLWQEVYNSVGGESISDLTGNSAFPDSPTSSGPITESYVGTMGNFYGQRISGWIIPTETARYRFYMAANDTAQLFLSPSEYACHKQLMIDLTTASSERNFDRNPPSDFIELIAGQRYFVEILHKEGNGSDHVGITWQKEGDPVPADGSEGIPAANLQYRTGGPDPDEICPPFGVDDEVIIIAGDTITIEALVNDLDDDQTSLTITGVSVPSIGTASVSADRKSVRFSSLESDSGTATLIYDIEDADGMAGQATITVSVRSLREGLALHYEFEDLTNGAIDSTGNFTTNGTLSGVVDPCPGEILGSAIEVGSGGVVNVPTAVLDNISDQITVSYWIKPSQFVGNGVITLSTGNSVASTSPLKFLYPWSTQALIDSDDDDSADGTRDRLGKFSGVNRAALLDRWTHIVFTKDATTGRNVFYTDNQVYIQSNSKTEPIGTADVFRFGNVQNYRGKLDDLRIYNRVLSEEEITALFELPGKPSVSLIASSDYIMENSGGSITYTLARTGAFTGALDVGLIITGTAENGIDYNTLATNLSIPDGQGSITFAMTPIDDAHGENTEAVNIRVENNTAYNVGGTQPLVNIGNDDVPLMSILTVDRIANTMEYRFGPDAQIFDAEPQWSTSLLQDSWTPLTGTPIDIGNGINRYNLPPNLSQNDHLFFRWKVE